MVTFPMPINVFPINLQKSLLHFRPGSSCDEGIKMKQFLEIEDQIRLRFLVKTTLRAESPSIFLDKSGRGRRFV